MVLLHNSFWFKDIPSYKGNEVKRVEGKEKKKWYIIFNMVRSQHELKISYLNQVPMLVPRIPRRDVQWH